MVANSVATNLAGQRVAWPHPKLSHLGIIWGSIGKAEAGVSRPGVDFAGLIASGHGHRVEINPITGNRQYHQAGNDVVCVVEILGGKQSVAAKLGVEEIEIEHWIDDHYVPTRYAEMIHELTGWSVWSIQELPVG